jgi:hypothetical protein
VSTITYPDGSQLTAIALTEDTLQAMVQVVTAQALGIIVVPLSEASFTALPPPFTAAYGAVLQAPFTMSMNLVTGQFLVKPASMLNLYAGQLVTGPGVPQGTVITGVVNGSVLLSNAATATSSNVLTVTDPEVFSKVRVGWQQQGQPGWNIAADTVILRAEMVDTDYGRMRDAVSVTDGNINTTTDVNTRAWRVYWTFYGPNSVDRARALRTALTDIQFVADELAAGNLYVNPSISQPRRSMEEFQGQWWTRVDLYAEFNEQVTETYTVGTVESVVVSVYNNEGLLEDFTVTAPSS